MKVLNWTNLTEPVTIDVIPAPLKDYSNSYADGKLYSYYNTSLKLKGSEIYVNILADSLVPIEHSDGTNGYFVGLGINQDFFDNATEIYCGYGYPMTDTLEQIELPTPFTRNNGQSYIPFYFDVEKCIDLQNKAYLIVVKNDIHFHFTIDTSTVNTIQVKPSLDPLLWKATTVDEMVDDFLFGINLADTDGNPLPDRLYIQHLNAAVQWLEELLDICIIERDIKKERQDYLRDDYVSWGFTHLNKMPIKEVTRLTLMYGNKSAVDIPLDWIQVRKMAGQLTLFPQSGSAGSLIIGQTGLLFGLTSPWSYAPQLWEIDYKAGIDKDDPDMPVALLKEAVYKRACTNILNVWGN